MLGNRKTNFLYYVTLTVLLLAQLPFWVLCFYTHPLGIHEWDWISNWAGDAELESVEGFWSMQKYWYMTTMGRYTSTAILSLTPHWFTFARFQWVFVFNLLFLNAGVYYLLRSWFQDWRSVSVWLVSLLIVAMYLFQLNNVYENIYNYMVVVIYHSGTIASLFLIGMIVRAFRQASVHFRSIAVMCVLALFIPGTNELSMISTGFVFAGVTAMQMIRRRSLPFWFWWVSLAFTFGSVVAVIAPGNYVRMDTYTGAQNGMLYYATLAAGVMVYQFGEWFATSLLLPAGAIWLSMYTTVNKSNCRKIAVESMVWLGGLMMMVYVFLFMYLRATGGISLPERLVDTLYLNLLLWAIFFLASFFHEAKGQSYVYLYGVLSVYIFFHLFLAGLHLDRSDVYGDRSKLSRVQMSSNIGNAMMCLLRGDAQRYDKAMWHSYDLVSSCTQDTCILPSLPVAPFGIYDPLFDRRTRRGEPFVGWYFQQRPMLVLYQQE